ncbi:hypothetical protein ACFOWE_24875 [Planomonospora corallina]|uniref:Uncharacterized protein n=1 Tax=Planomonospora corallina TaxID=1806052 RepID=A0ABV8IDK2_9ACTN
MYLITARLRAPESGGSRPPRMPARALRDLVLALAAPEDRIEHVYSAMSPAGADLGLFVTQPTLDDAESVAARLCRRCLGEAPGLAGWSLDGCGARLVPCLADAVLLGAEPGSVLPLQAADSRWDLSRN